MFKLFSSLPGENGIKRPGFIYRWFILSLCVHFLVAFFSLGFYHYDEHFQILEFAGFKAGWSHASSLPWEYAAQIRSAFQPFIAYCVIKAFGWLHITDPFGVSTFLRIISAFLGWMSTIVLTLACQIFFPSSKHKKWFIILSSVFAPLFFLHARFSSESWSGSFAFMGLAMILALIYRQPVEKKRNEPLILLLSGFILGLSYLCRVQSLFLFPGLFLWLIVLQKYPFKKLFLIGGGMLAAFLLGVIIDRWFYGVWVNTTYQYYLKNIVEGKAAEFGTAPWWWYFKEFIHFGPMPVQLVLILLIVISFVRFWKNPVVWVCFPFLIAHFLVSHKELRFLFPLAETLPLFIIMGITTIASIPALQNLFKKTQANIAVTAAGGIFLIYSCIGVLDMCTRAPSTFLYPIQSIYKNHNEPVDIIYNDHFLKGLFNGKLEMNFYKTPQMHFLYIQDLDSIKNLMRVDKRTALLMMSSRGYGAGKSYAQFQPWLVPEYYQLPEWMKLFDLNHWTDRTSFWRVYKIEPIPQNVH